MAAEAVHGEPWRHSEKACGTLRTEQTTSSRRRLSSSPLAPCLDLCTIQPKVPTSQEDRRVTVLAFVGHVGGP